jgi:hypothetical protein
VQHVLTVLGPSPCLCLLAQRCSACWGCCSQSNCRKLWQVAVSCLQVSGFERFSEGPTCLYVVCICGTRPVMLSCSPPWASAKGDANVSMASNRPASYQNTNLVKHVVYQGVAFHRFRAHAVQLWHLLLPATAGPEKQLLFRRHCVRLMAPCSRDCYNMLLPALST